MEPMEELAAELRAPPPPGLAGLEPQELRDLAAALREARHHQAAQLAAAGERALRFIPKLLRGPVRRITG